VLGATHNVLLAHGKAVQTIRAYAKKPPLVGFAPIGGVRVPDSNSSEDIETARKEMFSPGTEPFWSIGWYSDPIFLKTYPQEGLEAFRDVLPAIGPNDMDIIGQPLDFYGMNIYGGNPPGEGHDGHSQFVPGFPLTYFHWPVVPESVYWGTKFVWERYQTPIYITENGLSSMDWLAQDGNVYDLGRVDHLSRYLAQLQRAQAEGVDLRGYFHWSLMDNFEWAEGYKEHFGLVFIDHQTQARIPKISASYYKKVMAENAVLLPEAGENFLDLIPLPAGGK
jgi:beta-glucosidase